MPAAPNHDLAPGSIAVVLGTRPEIIKLAHIIRILGRAVMLVHTGQHYDDELSESFLDYFELERPTHYLGVGGNSRGAQIGQAVRALDSLLAEHKPSVVMVQGDTNAALAGGLAANARAIPLVHVEAGLRSHDRRMPEEHNRVVVDHLADLLCAPTEVSKQNLVSESIPVARIIVTGNTVVEAVTSALPGAEETTELLSRFGVEEGRFVLATFHRPENVDDKTRFKSVLAELGSLSLPVLLPLHPRSRRRAEENGLNEHLLDIEVIEPIGYREFLGLGAASRFLVSDSGGVQEEVSVYKKPVIVVRRSSERPEVLGTFARLCEPAEISVLAKEWLSDIDAVNEELHQIPSPYGDGSASLRTVNETLKLVGS